LIIFIDFVDFVIIRVRTLFVFCSNRRERISGERIDKLEEWQDELMAAVEKAHGCPSQGPPSFVDRQIADLPPLLEHANASIEVSEETEQNNERKWGKNGKNEEKQMRNEK
jgi:hypothetical protein